MTTVTQIKEAVQALPEDQFEEFSSRFDEYEERHWDRQIERDQKSDPLRDLMERAGSDSVGREQVIDSWGFDTPPHGVSGGSA
jgi:hypothetical protein